MTRITRRDFLQSLSVAAISGAFPSLFASETRLVAPQERILILIELNGGNDGLNTVVPYLDPDYIAARKNWLRLTPDAVDPNRRVIPFAEFSSAAQTSAMKPVGMGVHQSLGPLRDCWQVGEMAVVQGVGFPDQSRSHFEGIADWNRGIPITKDSPTSVKLPSGWLTRLHNAQGIPSTTGAHALHLGRTEITPVYGTSPGLRSIGMNSPNEYINLAGSVFRPTDAMIATANPALATIMGTMRTIQETNASVADVMNPVVNFSATFPDSALGGQAKSAAQLIAGGLSCPFYKLALSGFDTHGGQIVTHANLLADLAQTISALRRALIEANCWDRVLVMTYSEFGRRLKENASRGCDHGLAASHLMFGGKVRGGFYGTPPSLSKDSLDYRGDITPTLDVRRYFATGASFLGFSAEARREALNITNDGANLDLTPLECFLT